MSNSLESTPEPIQSTEEEHSMQEEVSQFPEEVENAFKRFGTDDIPYLTKIFRMLMACNVPIYKTTVETICSLYDTSDDAQNLDMWQTLALGMQCQHIIHIKQESINTTATLLNNQTKILEILQDMKQLNVSEVPRSLNSIPSINKKSITWDPYKSTTNVNPKKDPSLPYNIPMTIRQRPDYIDRFEDVYPDLKIRKYIKTENLYQVLSEHIDNLLEMRDSTQAGEVILELIKKYRYEMYEMNTSD